MVRVDMVSAALLIPCYAIVHRDHTEIFRTLKADREEPEVVEVIWDGRHGERRRLARAHDAERRRRDRRGPLPETLLSGGVVVGPQIPGPGAGGVGWVVGRG